MFHAEIFHFIRDGQDGEGRIGLDDSFQEKYNEMIECGCRLTVEIPRTNGIALTIEEPEVGDFIIEIIKGPPIRETIEKMLNKFNKEDFNNWVLGKKETDIIVKKMWVVGQWFDGERWDLQGVFDDETKAIKACLTTLYFIGPVILNKILPEKSIEWPGCYYPKLMSKPDIKENKRT